MLDIWPPDHLPCDQVWALLIILMLPYCWDLHDGKVGLHAH